MDDRTLDVLVGDDRDPEYVKVILIAGAAYAPVALLVGVLFHQLVGPLGYVVIAGLFLAPTVLATLDGGGLLVGWLAVAPLSVLGVYLIFVADPNATGIVPPFARIGWMVVAVAGFGTGGYLLGRGLDRVLDDPGSG